MSDAVPETVEFGSGEPTPRRWVRAVGVAIAGAAILATVAIWATQAGWLDNDAEADAHLPSAIAHPMASNPRALTAGVLAHIPDGVTVVWSTGSGDLTQGTRGIGPAATLRTTLSSSVLMRVGRDEFFLTVVIGPGNQQLVPDALGQGLITRDKQGRAVNEMVGASANGSPTLISESASPTSTADLPLSDADLKAILADPLVGTQTDAATLARSRALSSFTDSPPPLTWQA